MFNDLFSTYNVSSKVGNCNVSHKNWRRNDIPSWKFFETDTTANELNGWKASSDDVSFMDSGVLNAWKGTDNRKLVIIIPDELAAKMESDCY